MSRETQSWKLLYRVPWSVLTWFLHELCIFLPLFIIGLVLVPIAYLFGTERDQFQNLHFKLRKLMWLWDNDEDGIDGHTWWADQNVGKSQWGLVWSWYLRNPVNNLKYIPYFNPIITNPLHNQYIGTAMDNLLEDTNPRAENQWFYCWKFPHWGFYYYNYDFSKNTYTKFFIGWRIRPQDDIAFDENDGRWAHNDPRWINYKNKTVGFAGQFRMRTKLS